MKRSAMLSSADLPDHVYFLSPLAVALILAFLSPVVFAADNPEETETKVTPNANKSQVAEFDSAFLNTAHSGAGVDLSRFSTGNNVLPGVYRADIYLNNTLIGNENVEFKAHDDKSTYACLSSSLIASLNLKPEALPSTSLAPLKKEGVVLTFKH